MDKAIENVYLYRKHKEVKSLENYRTIYIPQRRLNGNLIRNYFPFDLTAECSLDDAHSLIETALNFR